MTIDVTTQDTKLQSLGNGHHALAGALTFETAASAVNLMPVQSGDQECTIDLSGVEAIDSAGLAVLVEWLAQAAKLKTTLQFSHVPPRLSQLANIAGVGKHFEKIS